MRRWRARGSLHDFLNQHWDPGGGGGGTEAGTTNPVTPLPGKRPSAQAAKGGTLPRERGGQDRAPSPRPGTYRPPGPAPWSPGRCSGAEDAEGRAAGTGRRLPAWLCPPGAGSEHSPSVRGSSAPRAGAVPGSGSREPPKRCFPGRAGGAVRRSFASAGRARLASPSGGCVSQGPQIPLLIKSIHYAQI